jgi:hypothetical protein
MELECELEIIDARPIDLADEGRDHAVRSDCGVQTVRKRFSAMNLTRYAATEV